MRRLRAADPDERLVAGPASLGRLARLLGLEPGWRLESVESLGDRLRLSVDGACRAGVLLRRASSQPCFAKAGGIDLSYEGADAAPELTTLLRDLAARLQGVSLESLASIVAEDPASSRSGLAAPGGADAENPDATCVTDRLGGNPGQWRRFLCGKEFEKLDGIFSWPLALGLQGRVRYITHGDYECTTIGPDLVFGGMTFLNYPPIFPGSDGSMLRRTVFSHWTTDLDETDVVLGARRKVDAFVRASVEQSREHELILALWTCTPVVTGDDLDGALARCRAGARCPVVVDSMSHDKKDFGLLEQIVGQLRSRPGFFDAERDPSAVNLFDCPARLYEEELRPLLDAVGVRVQTRVFPETSIRELGGYLSASAQVLTERFEEAEAVRRAFADLPIRTVFAPAPFGVEGTKAYARRVAESVGREAGFEEAWEAFWSGSRTEWELLREQARRLRLAFVVDEASAATFADPAFQLGIPVPRMLDEMGFGLDVLAYAPSGRLPKACPELARLPWLSRKPALAPFADREGLGRLLRSGDFHAVYSDIFFDSRITRAGKSAFSMRLLEPGAFGALRSLKRLLAACRLPFYRRYGRFLGGERDA